MADESPDSIDVRGARRRLARLAIAAGIAAVITAVVMRLIDAASAAPNADPVGASIRPLLGLVVFAMSTAWLTGLLARLTRRR